MSRLNSQRHLGTPLAPFQELQTNILRRVVFILRRIMYLDLSDSIRCHAAFGLEVAWDSWNIVTGGTQSWWLNLTPPPWDAGDLVSSLMQVADQVATCLSTRKNIYTVRLDLPVRY